MKASTLVRELQTILEQHGDLEILICASDGWAASNFNVYPDPPSYREQRKGIAGTINIAVCEARDHGMGTVSEFCSNCETEIEMRWNVTTLGYRAFCPVCGKRLMLCDTCQHPEGGTRGQNCDYSIAKDCCRHNKGGDI